MGSIGTPIDGGAAGSRCCKILIVGTGGNGMSCAVHLKRAGIDDLRIISRHRDFGGVWWQNRYPGCYTDLPIVAYQLEYAQKTHWPETHASGAEMARYLQSVAAENDLYRHTDFNTELLEAEWLEHEVRWKVTTNNGIYLADFLMTATGYLDESVLPNVPGMDRFKGRMIHTSHWPEDYSGAGETIAVIGTAASAVQVIPELQKVASKVVVLQRSAGYVLPLHKETVTEKQKLEFKENTQLLASKRTELRAPIDDIWENIMLGRNPSAADVLEKECRNYITAQGLNSQIADFVTPKWPLGFKRPTMNDHYYNSLTKPNVELVPEPLAEVLDNKVKTPSGREIEVDTIVFATGFLLLGSILHRIKRRDGLTVGEYQKGHPRAYKAVSTAGCPNLFLVGGSAPNSMVWDGFLPGQIYPIYVLETMKYMQQNNIRAMEVKGAVELSWKQWADEVLVNCPMTKGPGSYVVDSSGHNKGLWPGTQADMSAALSKFDPAAYDIVA